MDTTDTTIVLICRIWEEGDSLYTEMGAGSCHFGILDILMSVDSKGSILSKIQTNIKTTEFIDMGVLP